ncbi:MAG: YihA family ribosome biogenesis GTP-binding protein, partial [Candidatus Cloacimonetes bacterium]|nr:YihA family ribosome biogenesis GTP-binding protein [Candidatus Cloacimonadota bacterium]
EIAFVGKSNVGKSSLINTILNRKAIAKISRTPGKTRLINFFEIRFKTNNEKEGFIYFVDLPGYGYAKVSKAERESWKKMIQNYFDKRLQLKGVIAIIDIRHKADPKDIIMFEMLKKKGIPFAVIATKSDKIGKSKIMKTIKKLKSELQIENQEILPFSSLKKIGINEILNWISNQIL